MAATIKDIAARTGLGLATISKYLNGGNVRKENKEAIDRAILELDFTANVFARGLKTRRSNTIGVIIPELSNLFITSIITVVQDILRKRGYAMLVCDCRTDLSLEEQAVQFLLGKGVDGIINMPVSLDGKHLLPAIDKKLPIVLLDRMISAHASHVDAVMIDNQAATGSAVRHLLERGHRRIGVLVGPADVYTSQTRLQGYREALSSHGVPIDSALIQHSDYTLRGGYACMRTLAEQERPTAVLATNYEMTFGAIMAMGELGLSYPADISIIGFDHMDFAQVLRPPLTIIEQPIEEIGKQTAKLILDRLGEGAGGPAKRIMLPTNLRIGESVRDL